MTVAYIDSHKEEFGVEPICTTLRVAPSTYYAAKTRPPSARGLRDAVLGPLILALWVANYRVYGVHKMWKALHRSGETVGRDQVARLMRGLGVKGARRGQQGAHHPPRRPGRPAPRPRRPQVRRPTAQRAVGHPPNPKRCPPTPKART